MTKVGRNILLWVLVAVVGPVALVLLCRFLWWARLFLTPVLVGLIIAYLLDPAVRWFQRRGCSRQLALALLVLILTVTLAAVALVVVPLAQTELQQLVAHSADYYQSLEDWFTELYTSYFVGHQLPPAFESARQKMTENLNVWLPQWLSNTSSKLVQSLGAIVLGLLLGALSTFYFLLDFEEVKAGLRRVIPRQVQPQVMAVSGEVDAVIGRYLRGQATVLALLVVTATVALSIVGFFYGTKYALVIGLLMGLLQLVPALGITVTLIVACTVAFFTATHYPMAAMLVTAGVLIGINLVFDNIISPRIIGRVVGLHPLMALLSVLIGGWAFGFLGVVLAVPVVASVRVAIQHFYKPGKSGREDDASGPGEQTAIKEGAAGSED